LWYNNGGAIIYYLIKCNLLSPSTNEYVFILSLSNCTSLHNKEVASQRFYSDIEKCPRKNK
jgi:hypothetical protein